LNGKDRGRGKDGAYMGPAWTKPPGHSVVRQVKSMSMIKPLLAHWVCIANTQINKLFICVNDPINVVMTGVEAVS
jgi:hypothetical protein